MKINIEIESAYLEGDNIDDELGQKIQREVVNEIWGKIKDKVEEHVLAVAKSHVEERYQNNVREYVNAIIKSEKVKKPRWSDFEGDEITIEQYIKHLFDKDTPEDHIKKIVGENAKNYAEKCKDRYDLYFATQMIQKIKEVGMLKEGAEQALFNSESPKEN